MSVMVAEQGAAAAEAGASETSAGASKATRGRDAPIGSPAANRYTTRRDKPARTGGRTQQGSAPSRTGGRTQQGTQGGRSVRPGPAGRQGGSQRRAQPRRPRLTADSSGTTNYQAVVLAEFVAAVLLVAATPFAKKDSPGVSPYQGSDLLQLVALTLTFFVLALISGANRGSGRFAAWFGALILLTVGLAEAARLAKLLNVFGLESPAPADTSSQAG